ncbi:MAG: hypothetical protein GY696_02255 [Gammaproteobacteria bacterium]|nr:hypothetical protein [Gammaproteobacteria bacterium]
MSAAYAPPKWSETAEEEEEEGDVWDGLLNPRAPIHKDISQEGTEEDDDDIRCVEVDLVSSWGKEVDRDDEGREREIEIEQEERMRAFPRAHKKQRTASPDHRTDNATLETGGSSKKFKHSVEQQSGERMVKGKHRKSRRDDLGSDKEYDPRPSTLKDLTKGLSHRPGRSTGMICC